MRVRNKAWAPEELEKNIHMIHNGEECKGRWNEVFGNDNPIHVEIGCGKGRFISEMAKANPDINYVGIERQTTVIAIAARKIDEEQKNIFLMQADVEYLENYFDVGEIKRLYINFCDPWPKKRQAKRRLTHKNFLEKYKGIFGDKAEIFFKTDNRNLFEFSLEEMCNNGWKFSNISLDLHNSQCEGNIMTEYEEKFSSKGMPIYRLEARWEKEA